MRHDILRCAYVKRCRDGDLIAARGDPPEEWMACAKGAVRVSSTSLSGKQITFDYIEPGIWFGDVAILDGDRRTHDVYAHGETTILCVAKTDFQKILSLHVEFYQAMLKLQARRIRQLFGLVERPQHPALAFTPGQAVVAPGTQLRRSLAVQSPRKSASACIWPRRSWPNCWGTSRQRVNQELKSMEREEAIRIEAGGIVIRNREALLRISEAEH